MSATQSAVPVAAIRGSPRFARAIDLIGQYGAPVMILVVFIIAAFAAPSFFKPSNLSTVAIQAAVLGIVAIGQTLVLLVRGLDMSVSAVVGLGLVIVVSSFVSTNSALAVAVALAVAMAIGLANGLLITKRGVPPFIATFGMLVFVNGARLALTNGQASGTVPSWMRTIGAGGIGQVPWAAVIWVLITLLASVVLHYTRYGRWIRAIGANPAAARYSGIAVDRVVILCFVACSALALIAGIILSGYVGYVDQSIGTDSNLNSIAASIVGGTTFTGGKGNMIGTAAGVILLSTLTNLVVVAGLGISWEYAVIGAVLVIAVAVQGLRASLLPS